MDIKVLKEITKLMNDNDLIEVEVESKGLKLKLRKAGPVAPTVMHAVAAPAPAAAASTLAATAAATKSAEEANWKPITSPIPGTVYLKPNPDAANFVSEGLAVDPAKVVCLIEAMKVFNQIPADVTGTIAEVLVKSNDAVEFGQPLFKVRL